MWETMKMAAILHRIALDPSEWPGSADALSMCWQGGASVVGQDLGRLEVGALGDVAVLGWGRLLPAPRTSSASNSSTASSDRPFGG